MNDRNQKGKWLIYRNETSIISALLDDNRLVKLNIDSENEFLVGNIYLGKVQNIVKNINAAFVEIASKQLCFLPLEDVTNPCITNREYDGRVLIGDEIIVQIKQEPLKTKQATVTTNLNLTGKYCVLSLENTSISFSHKIEKNKKQNLIKQLVEEKILSETGKWIYTQDKIGVIFRTNIQELTSILPLKEELEALTLLMQQIVTNGKHRTVFSKLYEAESSYISHLSSSFYEEYSQIVTDDTDIFENLKKYFTLHQHLDQNILKLYTDSKLKMPKLYSMDTKIQEALQKKVWMKSGAYLVIEPTETLTVIDVNTGKYSGKGTGEETFLKINLEACEEIALQLKLRNISGMIIIDFINLKNKQAEVELITCLKKLLKKDPIKCDFIDMTPLGLVEITRKRISKSLLEQATKKGN